MGLEMLSGGTVSDPRGHVKNHPDRGNFSVAAGRIRPRVPPRQRRDHRQRCLLAMGATLAGRVKKVEEGPKRAREGRRAGSQMFVVFFRRVVNVMESEAFGIVHSGQIAASARSGAESR